MGWLTNTHTGELRVARCKRWACRDCGPRRSRQFAKRIAKRLRRGYFCTFTVDRAGEVSRENNMRLNRCWRPLSQWMKRNANLRGFAWVNEIGSLHGRLHKHAILDCDRFDYNEARGAVVRAGFGVVCDFSPIKHGAGASHNYIAKYLGKNLADRKWPKYARRCQTTVPADKPIDKWEFAKLELPARLGFWQELRGADSIERFNFAENMRLEREAQTWTPQLEFPLALSLEEKLHQPMEGDHRADSGIEALGPRGP